MSKRHNITYVKPEEPAFLRRLKEQAGYQEGPNLDTKRQQQQQYSDSEEEDFSEEQPQVVVLKTGDLTADQAKLVQQQLDQEALEKPADLNCPIVFKAPKKKQTEIEQNKGTSSKRPAETKESENTKSKKSRKSDKEKNKKAKNNLLSFDDEEDEQH